MPKKMLWTELLFSYFPIARNVLWQQMLTRFAFLFVIWLSGLLVYALDGLMIDYALDMNVYLGYFVTSFIILFGSYVVQDKLSNIIQDFHPLLKLDDAEFQKFSIRLERFFYSFYPCIIIGIALGIFTGVPNQFQLALVEGFKLHIAWNMFFNSFGLLLTATAIWMFVSIWITIFLISRQPLNVRLSPETIARFRELSILALWFSLFYFIGISIGNFTFFTSGQAFSLTEILLSPYLFFIAIGVFGILFPFYNIHLALIKMKKQELSKISEESQKLLKQLDQKLMQQSNLREIEPSISIMHHRLFNLQVKERYVKEAQEWSKNLGGLISSTPAVSDGAVYIPVGGTSNITLAQTGGANGNLFKLDTTDGSIIWQAGLPYVYVGGFGFGQWQPREFHGSPCVADGMVFQSANAWTTYGLNATTGQILWNYSIYSGGMQNDITPAYADGKVYVQSFFSLACLEASNGTKLWDVWGAHAVHGDPVIALGKVYFASDFKVMWSIDADTGEKIDFVKWDDTCYSGACIYDNKLYWGTAGMKLYCFEDEPYGVTTYYRAEPEPPEPVPPTIEDLLSPLQGSVDELEGYVSDVQGSVSDIQDSINAVEGSVSDLEGKVSVIEDSIFAVEDSVSSVSEVEGSINTLDSTVNDLQSSVDNLESNTSNLTTYLLILIALVIFTMIIAVYFGFKSRK